jgi:hypothetical protein
MSLAARVVFALGSPVIIGAHFSGADLACRCLGGGLHDVCVFLWRYRPLLHLCVCRVAVGGRVAVCGRLIRLPLLVLAGYVAVHGFLPCQLFS